MTDQTPAYRYTLERVLPPSLLEDSRDGTLLWVMLNPSTATASINDPTIRRCIGFAESWGFARMVVVNLFAARSTVPSRLKHMERPTGPDNDRHILEQARAAKMVVAAWGQHRIARLRAENVLRIITREAGQDVHALAFTTNGSPQHPLYVPADTQPVLWRSKGS